MAQSIDTRTKMKTKIVSATLAMAVAATLGASLASAEELCSPGGPLDVPGVSSDPSLTATNCVWASDTRLVVGPNVTSLAITGGHTEGLVTIELAPVDAFHLTISGGFESKKGTLYFNGNLPSGSSITIADSHFYAAGPGKYLAAIDFAKLKVQGTAFHAHQNNFFANADTASYVLQLPKADASNFVFEDNFFNLTEKSGASIGVYNSFMRSSLVIRRNRFVSDTNALQYAIELSPPRSLSNGKSFRMMGARDGDAPLPKDRDGEPQQKRRGDGKRHAQPPVTNKPKDVSHAADGSSESPMRQSSFQGASIQWGNVTDEEARDLYGKSSYEIVENEFVNAAYPWYIKEYDGKDMMIARNTLVHTSSYLSPGLDLSNMYYPVTVAVVGNTFNATEFVYNELKVWEMPEKSTYSLSGNTYLTVVKPESFLIYLRNKVQIPESSAILINDNEVIDISDVNKTVGYVPAKSYLVGYTYNGASYGDPSLTPANIGNFSLCNNVMYGVKLDTDSLVNSSFYWQYQPLIVVPVSDCEVYTTTSTTTSTTTTTTTSTTLLSSSTDETTLEGENVTESPTRIITNAASGRSGVVNFIFVVLFGLIALV